MIKGLLVAGLAVFSANSAQALELAWKGDAFVTATSGCTRWDPLKGDKRWYAFLYPRITGVSGNPSQSVFSIHDNNNTAEGFTLVHPGIFTNAFKRVTAFHVYTYAYSYPASLKIVSQEPAYDAVTSATEVIAGTLQISGFDNTPTCLVTLTYTLLRHVENP